MTGWAGLLALVQVVAADPSAAPPASPPPTEPIVITGEREDADDAARALARVMTERARPDRALARFTSEVCVVVAGLPATLGRAIGERMVANAAAADLPVAREPCNPTLLVAVVKDGLAELRDLRRSGRVSIDADELRIQLRRQAKLGGPVKVISAAEETGGGGSRIGAPIRVAMLASVVLIERDAVPGVTVTQLADYATVRALARTADVGDEGTILSLFAHEAGPPPAEMTTFDRAYLRALYASWEGDTPAATMSRVVKEAAGSR